MSCPRHTFPSASIHITWPPLHWLSVRASASLGLERVRLDRDNALTHSGQAACGLDSLDVVYGSASDHRELTVVINGDSRSAVDLVSCGDMDATLSRHGPSSLPVTQG